MDIEVKVLEEHGYLSAILGLSLSYYREGYSLDEWWTDEKILKAEKQARVLAFKGGGHSKYLESINVWLLVKASRGWHAEMDTYRVGITKNSASSMHTLMKEPVTKDNFVTGTSQILIDNLNRLIADKVDITTLKANLPEGYLQTRQCCMNYMTLQNIIRQRTGHRLHYWDTFISSLLLQVEHPELLIQENK